MLKKMKNSKCLNLSYLALIIILISLIQVGLPVFSLDETPKWGGTLIWARETEAQTLNNAIEALSIGGAMRVGMSISDHLLEVDMLFGGPYKPALATSWEVNPEATKYTFQLREDVTWHDGNPFTSHDVKITLEEVSKNELCPYNQKYKRIESVETPDDYTVVVNMKEPYATFLTDLGVPDAPFILPAHLYEGTDWSTNEWNRKPIGTGPYKFKEWVPGSHITLERYEDHYSADTEAPLNYLDKIMYTIMSGKGAVLAFERNNVQMSESVSYDDALRLSSNINVKIFVSPIWVQGALQFNLRREPFNNPLVREAMGHAINKDLLSELATEGQCPPVFGQYAPNSWAYNENATTPDYNPDKAEELLDEAGYPRGEDDVRFRCIMTTMMWGPAANSAQVLKEMFEKVGIAMDTEIAVGAAYADKMLVRHDFDLTIGGGMQGPDPSDFYAQVASDGHRNCMGYNNSRVDELFNLGLSTGDTEQRKQYYYEIQDILANDLPRINLWTYCVINPTDSHFHDFFCDPETYEKGLYQAGLSSSFKGVWYEGGSTKSPMEVRAQIETSQSKIESLEASGYDVSAAIKRLENVENMVNSYGDYDEAFIQAEMAPSLSIVPIGETTSKPSYELWISIIALIISIATAIYSYTGSRVRM